MGASQRRQRHADVGEPAALRRAPDRGARRCRSRSRQNSRISCWASGVAEWRGPGSWNTAMPPGRSTRAISARVAAWSSTWWKASNETIRSMLASSAGSRTLSNTAETRPAARPPAESRASQSPGQIQHALRDVDRHHVGAHGREAAAQPAGAAAEIQHLAAPGGSASSCNTSDREASRGCESSASLERAAEQRRLLLLAHEVGVGAGDVFSGGEPGHQIGHGAPGRSPAS